MNGFRTAGAGKLVGFEAGDVFDSASLAKVKITKVLVNNQDAAIIAAGGAGETPVVPGRFAVGVVTETGADCFGLERGNRVYICPDTPCGKCYACASGKSENCSELRVAGENEDGFLRDFAVLPCSNLFVLPDSVTDGDALYIDYLAHAVSALSQLEIKKGDHVVVIGAGTLGIILSCLIIYYQAVPILIDSDEEKLARARSCGIYYTLSTDSDLFGNVAELTGGRMAERVIYIADSGLNTNIALNLARYAGEIAFLGFGGKQNLSVNVNRALTKQLVLRGISTGYGNTATSINLAANKVVPLSKLYGASAEFECAKDKLEEMAQNYMAGKEVGEIIVNFIKY